MPGAHAEPVPGRYQGCSSPLCPVGESAPFSCPISPELASKRQFPALSMGKLAPFPTPSAPNWRQSGSFPLCLVCESAPFPASSAPNWHQSSSFPLCPVCELAPCPRPRQLGTGVKAAVFRLYPVGESALFSCPICPGTGGKAAVFRSARCVNWRPVPAPVSSALASGRQSVSLAHGRSPEPPVTRSPAL